MRCLFHFGCPAIENEGRVGIVCDQFSVGFSIKHANRQNGPEQCMQLAHERAPEGFDALEDIFAPDELKEMADRYKQLKGLKKSA